MEKITARIHENLDGGFEIQIYTPELKGGTIGNVFKVLFLKKATKSFVMDVADGIISALQAALDEVEGNE